MLYAIAATHLNWRRSFLHLVILQDSKKELFSKAQSEAPAIIFLVNGGTTLATSKAECAMKASFQIAQANTRNFGKNGKAKF